jgi:hypothetical protein
MKGRIALFLHQPKCSVQSGNGIMRALSPNYTFKIFTRHEVERDFFDDVDMIAFPGGIGDADSYDYLLRENAGRVQDFVQNGGRYLGICMGAYWASHYYLNIVKDIDAEQYIRRPGTDTRRPHAKAQRVIWQGQEENMFFYDGCSLIGNGVSTSDVWAVYPNGDPMALIQNRIGLIGCHPESDKHWYDSYSWMNKHWHEFRHHDLLLDFADAIMSK